MLTIVLRSRLLLTLGGLLCVGGLEIAPARADEAEDFFEAKIRPVLAGKCFKCHGGDGVNGELRVDGRAALLKGGESGTALVPGQAEASLLLKALRREEGVSAMPPDKPLPAETVRDFATWIAAGAKWPEKSASLAGQRHWAFEPVKVVHPPTSDERAANPIDLFVSSKLREKGLVPNARAEKRTLLRRATFDLTGLPPTPDEMQAFLADESAEAFEKAAERLLASKHYGERWGRHWLDVVRYADTAGETADFPLPHAWRYRNYVIDAFNADKPYDEFLREQIAGDLLAAQGAAAAEPISPERYAELVTATGYLAIARRFGYDIEKDHYLTIDDTLDTLGKSALGLALGCARCHDHKYDPITAADYYGLFGIFESTRYPFTGCEKTKAPRDMVPLVAPREGSKETPPPTLLAYAVAEGSPHHSQIHLRGDPETRGAIVPRRFPKFLGGQTVPENAGSGRLQLAEWVTSRDNPLTARVMANRVWQYHFGSGLVKTPNDFGTRGSPPSHPELLDYLAGRLVAEGWSIKSLHRLILSSETYQRASADSEANERVDPNNEWLWKFSRRRLAAEEIRDALLAVSGDLDPTPGGPHPFPEEKSWGYTQHAPFAAVYEHDRRSVYLMTQRLKRHPFLALFDGPDASASTPARFTTTVPTQALYFLNDPFVHAKSQRFAARLLKLPSDDARLTETFELAYGRIATEAEAAGAKQFIAGYLAELGDVPEPERAPAAWSAWLRAVLGSNEFLHVD